MSKLTEFNGLFAFHTHKCRKGSYKLVQIRELNETLKDSMHGMNRSGWIYAYIDNDKNDEDKWTVNTIHEAGHYYCNTLSTADVDAWFEHQELSKLMSESEVMKITRSRSL